MRTEEFPETTEGSNWTVAVFRCPRKNWSEILSSFFSELGKLETPLIPHYKIVWYDQLTDSMTVSFRVLRKQEHEEPIKAQIDRFLKGYDHSIDPKEAEQLSIYHHWMTHGSTNAKWTRERCQILSKISKFVLEIIKSDTSRDDKEEWTHMFSNMAAVFEIFKIYSSPETILNPDTIQYRVLKYG